MKEPFSFSRKQRLGLIGLALIILFELLTYWALPYMVKPKPHSWNSKQWNTLIQSIHDDTSSSYVVQAHRLTPFRFDPNTLDEAGFIQLGLGEKLAGTIIHYRNKGGHFYKPESFKKIWGLHPDDFKQLEPFIAIPTTHVHNEEENIMVDINHCDTTALIALNGIGSWMANQIISYRNRLGGFVRKEQVKEVYGFRAETWIKIKDHLQVKKIPIRKVNLNKATLQEITKHPYLQGEIGLALVEYRKNHDYHIDSLQELRQIPLINEELFRKIAAYISLQ